MDQPVEHAHQMQVPHTHLPGFRICGLHPAESTKLEAIAVLFIESDLLSDFLLLHLHQMLQIQFITQYTKEGHIASGGQGRGAKGLGVGRGGYIGVVCIVPLTPILEAPVLEPAFAQMLPALFGGLGVAFVSKNFKIAIAPILLMLVLFIFVPALNAGTVGIMVPVSVLFTIAVARVMYKRGVL